MQGLNKTINVIKDFYKKVVLRPAYYAPVLFFSFVAYAFSIFSRTYSVDDPARYVYFTLSGNKIAGLRWAQFFTVRLFATVAYTPFVEELIGLIFLVLSATIFSTILYYLIDKDKKDFNIIPYTLFSSIFITFPLINEIWEYYEVCIFIGLAYVVVALSLLYQVVNDNLTIKEYIFLGLFLSYAAAGIESDFIAYITFTFIILYIKRIQDKKFNWLLTGMKFAVVFVLAIVFRIVIGYALLFILNVERSLNGTTGIYWIKNGFDDSLQRVIKNLNYYLYKSQSYFPIGEYLIALIAFTLVNIAMIFKKGLSPLLIGLFMALVPFLLSIMQGLTLPFRAAHIISVFVAFVVFYTVISINTTKYKVLKTVICIFFFFLAYRQSVTLHTLLALNNQRSDNEAMVIRTLGQKLYSEYDLDKPVVFCGFYDLGNNINYQIEDQTETNVQSMLNWGTIAFENQSMMKEMFSYYGFDIKVLDDPYAIKDIWDYTDEAIVSDMKPLEIREFDNYILVYLG